MFSDYTKYIRSIAHSAKKVQSNTKPALFRKLLLSKLIQESAIYIALPPVAHQKSEVICPNRFSYLHP